MRVSIEHFEDTVGFIRRRTIYNVSLVVDFSETELAIIKQRKLMHFYILERGAPEGQRVNPKKPDEWNLSIGKLMRGRDVFGFSTPIEAKAYEGVLTEKLKELKGFIDGNEAIEEKQKSFEL